ncbi:hypothetical protein DL770_008638 [Monosporascus sp. CRB-9-2]|nr:hypothetical protein DL770_008638 [Monosporascus sp. CRB-9-2]
MVSWKLPTKYTGRGSFIVTLVLLLMLPATMIAPLLTGAVDWTTTFAFKDGGVLPSVITSVDPNYWYWYLYTSKESRSEDGFALTATGIAAELWAGAASSSGYRCRHLVNEMKMDRDTPIPVNSTVEDAVLPCIEIHNLTWDQTPWDENVLKLFQENAPSISLVNTSPINSQFWDPGNAIVYDFKPWDSRKHFNVDLEYTRFPSPTIFSGTKKVLLLLRRQDTNDCAPVVASIFGNDSSMAQIKNAYPLVQNEYHENCYLSGTISFTAGAVKSTFSRFISSRVIEAVGNYPQIEPSLWTEEALFQMPDVMSRITKLNNSHVPTWDNVDDYIRAVTAISYMAAWDAFYSMTDNTNPVDLKVNQRVDMLKAQVHRGRVYAWLAINMLLTASGIVLLVFEALSSKCQVTDGPTAALMTDTSALEPGSRSSLSAKSHILNDADKQLRIVKDTGDVDKWRLKLVTKQRT